ncbi:hypothetical protein [Chengkuizengella marina]|uniref:Uncharacterized protein n=1 Tax=Chengkuizengella marina TaxID=2507566 RepID=A0A6N9Q3E1_9BACL|nr:hypothetical protein [Chengkuizengella marina]NBI29327.1 hypothetical protein [Chengkuizengella marina]
MFFDNVYFEKNSYLQELRKNEDNLIGSWGIETADSKSFLSLENGGYDYKLIQCQRDISQFENKFNGEYEFHDGRFNLNIVDKVLDNKVIRTNSIYSLKDSYFMDFVTRFQFNKSIFPIAELAGLKFEHKNEYINHQYETDKVKLYGPNYCVNIRVLSIEKVPNFKQVIYVRGSAKFWVVHVRLFPRKYDKEIVKLVKYTSKARPLPDNISKILLKSPLAKHLWYNGEKSRIKLPINAFGLVKLMNGEKLSLKTEAVFSKI